MTLIRCITGSETFSEGNGTFVATLEPSTGFDIPGSKGVFISEAAKRNLHVSSNGKPAYLPAATTGLKEQGCFWDGSYEVPEGAILRVYARRRVRVGPRAAIEEGLVFIRARANGPLQRLQFRRIDSRQSTNAMVLIEGRFDIISLREAGAARVPIQAQDLSLSKPEKARSVMTCTEIAAELKAPAKAKIETVRSHDGESVEIVSQRHRRAIKL